MADAKFTTPISEEDSHKSYRVVDGDFNPMDDGPIHSSLQAVSPLGTIDGNRRHQRIISNIESNAMKADMAEDNDEDAQEQIRNL